MKFINKTRDILRKSGLKRYLFNKLHYPRNVIKVEKGKFLYFNPSDVDGARLEKDYREEVLISVWRRVIEHRKPSLVIDIGASYGLFTLSVTDDIKTVAFEPNPYVYSCLERSISRSELENTRLIKKAVSDVPKTSQLVLRRNFFGIDSSGSAYLYSGDSGVEVDVITLDNCLNWDGSMNNLIIKIDVEGSEPGVFRGGDKFLSSFDDLDGICEFNDEHIKREGFSSEKFYEMLSKQYFTWGYFPHSQYFYDLNGISIRRLKKCYYKIRPSGPNVHLNIVFSTDNDIENILNTILPVVELSPPFKEQIP